MKKISLIFIVSMFCVIFSISAFAKSDIYYGYVETENTSLAINDISVISGGNIIRTVNTKGKNCLFLPSCFDESTMWLTADTTAKEVWVYRDNEYITELKNAKSFNLKNIAVYDEAEDSYILELRSINADTKNETLEYSEYMLYIMKSENVGAMFISFADPSYGRAWVDSSPDHSNDSAVFTEVSMCMLNEKGGEVYNNTLTQFKGRGNTTWAVDAKKPYQIKLNKKTDLLESGNPANKNKTWVLIANSLDMTLFRNAMALDIAQYLGLKESPEYKFIDLYFDGIYRGSYLLCEKVQINSGRIEIKDSEDFTTATDKNAAAQCTNSFGCTVQYNPTAVAEEPPENGGYLLEQDIVNYAVKENCWFKTPGGNYIVIKSPECATKEQALYISELYAKMWNATRKGKYEGVDVSGYIDIDSLASICLLNEYLLNVDYITSSSYFFFPEKGNEKYEYKFYAGPAWDFDGSMGARCDNETFLDPSCMRWYGKGYFASKKVKEAVIEKAINLYEMKNIIFSVSSKTDEATGLKSMSYYKDLVSGSEKMNYRVNDLAKFILYKYFDSYREGYDYTYDFMNKRHDSVLVSIITPEVLCERHGHDYSDGVCRMCGKICSCGCHRTGFSAYLWNIILVFLKVLNIQRNCVCGIGHFDSLV